MYGLSRTPSFTQFQKRVGNSTYCANTAYVGLELVARGADKPADLRVQWQKPQQPQQIANQTRSLIQSAILTFTFDALDEYLRSLATEDWLLLSDHQRKVLAKSITKKRGKAYSVLERVTHTGLDCSLTPNAAHYAMVGALAAWRNQLIHGGRVESSIAADDEDDSDFRSRLTKKQQSDLLSFHDCLSEQYKTFDVGVMLGHLVAGKAPTRKDLVALVSSAQNLARAIDKQLLQSSMSTVEQVESFVKLRLRQALLSTDGDLLKKIWGKTTGVRLRKIRSVLEEAGFTSSSEVLSPRIEESFLVDAVELSRDKFVEELAQVEQRTVASIQAETGLPCLHCPASQVA